MEDERASREAAERGRAEIGTEPLGGPADQVGCEVPDAAARGDQPDPGERDETRLPCGRARRERGEPSVNGSAPMT
jgi:hypothetical protein